MLWTGISAPALAVGCVLYFGRMITVTMGYHRYFSHRSFKTSRAFQFVLAFVTQMSAQRGRLFDPARRAMPAGPYQAVTPHYESVTATRERA